MDGSVKRKTLGYGSECRQSGSSQGPKSTTSLTYLFEFMRSSIPRRLRNDYLLESVSNSHIIYIMLFLLLTIVFELSLIYINERIHSVIRGSKSVICIVQGNQFRTNAAARDFSSCPSIPASHIVDRGDTQLVISRIVSWAFLTGITSCMG